MCFMSKIAFDNNFNKILTFYLFECPVEKVSRRGQTFKQIGWKGSSRFQMLERLLKGASGISDERWQILDSSSEVEKRSSSIQRNKQFLFSDISRGRVQSFIYSIRNAFAHGSFDIIVHNDEKYYYFENDYCGNMRSRLLLSEQTLLRWYEIIRTRPEFLTKKSKIKLNKR